MNTLDFDRKRYGNEKPPRFQVYYRRCQNSHGLILKLNSILFRLYMQRNHIEMSYLTKIDAGLYIGHPFSITIGEHVVIGKNCNIHKGVTIGQENRGLRKGSPIIGDEVWIGVNSTIVGAITIGNDVLIAPNTYVNSSIPNHSVVYGNPCQIKQKVNATEGYINRKVIIRNNDIATD